MTRKYFHSGGTQTHVTQCGPARGGPQSMYCTNQLFCDISTKTPMIASHKLCLVHPLAMPIQCLHKVIPTVYIMHITDNANIRKSVGHIGLYILAWYSAQHCFSNRNTRYSVHPKFRISKVKRSV